MQKTETSYESLQDTDGRCVFVALAKRMDVPEDVIEGAMEEILDELYDRSEEPRCNHHFTKVGVTPKMLIRFAEKNDMGCLALHGNIAYHRSLSDSRRTLVFSWWSGHCFIYTSAREFHGFKVHDIEKPEPQSCPMLRGTIPCKTPHIQEWQPYTEPQKGHFYVERDNIQALRESFIRDGQCPSTKLSGLTEICKLVVKADSEAGKRREECHIHTLPRYYLLITSLDA